MVTPTSFRHHAFACAFLQKLHSSSPLIFHTSFRNASVRGGKNPRWRRITCHGTTTKSLGKIKAFVFLSRVLSCTRFLFPFSPVRSLPIQKRSKRWKKLERWKGMWRVCSAVLAKYGLDEPKFWTQVYVYSYYYYNYYYLSHFCRVFTIICLKQNMFLGYIIVAAVLSLQ